MLLIVLLLTICSGFTALHAEQVYSEIKGARQTEYLVKDIGEMKKPHNYVIGKTKYLLIEVMGLLAIAGALMFGIFHGTGRWIAHKRKPVQLEFVRKEFIYNLIIRAGHWLNAIATIVLLISGFMMHYIGPTHQLGLIHNFAGISFFILNTMFILYELATFDFKQFVVEDWEIREGIIKQAIFYAIGIFKGEEHPYHMEQKHRLNPLQKMAYFSVMFFLVPLIGFTGIILLFPDELSFYVNFIGIENMRYVFVTHLLSAFAMISYLIGHIYLATTGDTISQHFEVMLNGYHRVFKYKEKSNP